jgi:hypothetical protein
MHMTAPKYDTINSGNILLSAPFPKRSGTRPGDVILVDRGDQYVVACRYWNEETLVPDREWGNGNYFGGPTTTQSVALQEAIVLYQKTVGQLC